MNVIARIQKKNITTLLLDNINQAIVSADISKTEIAKRLGVNYSTVWRILHGKRGLKPEHIAEIAFMTGKTPNDFFTVSD